MSKLNIITGKWRTKDSGDIYADGYYVGSTRSATGRASNKDIDSAHLIVDAGNTYQATGLLPSEMAERIKALEDQLWEMAGVRSHNEDGTRIIWEGVCTDLGCGCHMSMKIAKARALLLAPTFDPGADTDETVCDGCGESFIYERDIEVTYVTHKKP